MDMYVAVSEPRVCEMVDAAARQAGCAPVRLARLPEPGGGSRSERTGVVVHDLLPDPERQVERLGEMAGAWPSLRVYLLLPVIPSVLRTAVRHGGHLPLLGVDLTTPELTSALLADHLRAALASTLPGLVVWARVQGWPLAAPLRDLARATLVGVRVHRRVAKVAREAGLGYERVRLAARQAGVGAPGVFAEALRLGCAAIALAHGARVYRAAQDHGFRDAEHLCERFRHRFGITPSQARALREGALLDELERRWFGGGIDPDAAG
jgi:AraC-like DNA-binding protein